MSEKTENTIKTISLTMVLVGAIGAIFTGVSAEEVSNGVVIAEGVVAIVGGIIAFITNKVKK